MDKKSSKREITTPSEEHGVEGSLEKKNSMNLKELKYFYFPTRGLGF